MEKDCRCKECRAPGQGKRASRIQGFYIYLQTKLFFNGHFQGQTAALKTQIAKLEEDKKALEASSADNAVIYQFYFSEIKIIISVEQNGAGNSPGQVQGIRRQGQASSNDRCQASG